MTIDRKRLRELAMAATPGPWTEDAFDWGGGNKEPTGWINARDKAVVEYAGCGSHEASWNDSDLAFVLAANPQTILALLDALDAAEQRATDNARDARRYRWLRERVDSHWWHELTETGAALDAAIDAAIQAQERTP